MVRLQVKLTTVEGREGTQWLSQEGSMMEWTADGDDETATAVFTTYKDAEPGKSVEVDGDDWRQIEDQGELSYVWFWVRRGVRLEDAVDAAVNACDPEGYDIEYEQALDEKDAEIKQLRFHLYRLRELPSVSSTYIGRSVAAEATRAWNNTAPFAVKQEVVRRAKLKAPEVSCFEDAIFYFGSSLVREVEESM